MRKNGNARGQRRGRRRPEANQMISHPPQIGAAEIRHNVALRFVANAAVANTTVTFGNLLDCVLMAITAILPNDVFQLVKVRRVRMWSVPVVGGATTLSVSFAGTTAPGAIGDADLHTDTSMGIEPAHVDARPKRLSQAAQFQAAPGGNTAFVLSGITSGTVIDLELSYKQIFAAQGGTPVAGNASVGATPGLIYTRGLDGLAAAATKFPCVIGSAI